MTEPRRTQDGRYKVCIPEISKATGKPLKGKEIAYTRVSNVSKILEDGNSLLNWRGRMTIQGLALEANKLLPMIRTLMLDPDGNKKALDKVVEECLQVAGANRGSDWGTMMHQAIQDVVEGRMTIDQYLLEDMRTDLYGWQQLMADSGLEILEPWCEHMIVHDEHQVAGSFDYLLRAGPGVHGWPEGEIRIGDAKTTAETSINYAWNAYAVQLSLYSHGVPYRQHPAFGGERVAWPEGFNPDKGLIIHVPKGGKPSFAELDLVAGVPLAGSGAR